MSIQAVHYMQGCKLFVSSYLSCTLVRTVGTLESTTSTSTITAKGKTYPSHSPFLLLQ